jgi:hypothetical protein
MFAVGAAGCAGYIGTAMLFEGWQWPLPKNVVTFSNFSSASVS